MAILVFDLVVEGGVEAGVVADMETRVLRFQDDAAEVVEEVRIDVAVLCVGLVVVVVVGVDCAFVGRLPCPVVAGCAYAGAPEKVFGGRPVCEAQRAGNFVVVSVVIQVVLAFAVGVLIYGNGIDALRESQERQEVD